MEIQIISPVDKINKIKAIIPDLIGDYKFDNKVYIAGGAITSIFTNTDVNDLDLYVCGDFEILATRLLTNATVISLTDKSILVNYSGVLLNLVVIKKFKDLEDIFNSFDFTCVMGAYDIMDEKFHLHPDFLIDNASRFLKFNRGTLFPLMSLMRVKKYVDKGYFISRNEMLRIALMVSNLNINSYKELENQIGGLYGLKIEDFLDITKPFDLLNVVDEISLVVRNYDEFYEFNDYKVAEYLTKLIIINTNKNKTYIEVEDNKILVLDGALYGNMTISEDENIDDFIKEHKIKKHNGKFKMYKHILNNDGVLCSHMKNDFIYELGMIVKTDNDKGLFAGTINNLTSLSFYGRPKSVTIELLCDVKDIKKLGYQHEYGGYTDMSFKQFYFNKIINNIDN